MSGIDWVRVQSLFERALEQPPEARAKFLRKICRDEPVLIDEVSSLLAAHDSGDSDPASMATSWLRAVSAPEPPRFMTGDRLADRYEIRDLLGVGGMGEVYEAWDTGLSILVALKTLRISTDTEELRRRLKMEGFLARSVWHPNVCRVYDLGRHDDAQGTIWFLTMERLNGVTLSSRLRDQGKFSQEHAHRLAEQMTAALGAAHAAGVVHLDFKPGNVLLVKRDGAEDAVVTDFGIARWVSAFDAEGPLTRSAPPAGTPAYMAPEQLNGESGGPAADIYALGVVLYEMVTGRLPFPDGSTLEAAKRRLSTDPPSPRKFTPALDAHWESAILRCLERDPARRFPRPEAVLGVLAGRAAEEGPSAVAPLLRSRSTLPMERNDFIGRTSEIDSLDQAFAGDTRLVTLVGAAGMGKTRLAVRYARRSLESWPGGVWFCDLREARDLGAITAVVARALDVPLGRLDPIQQLSQAIAGRGQCILIFDNFEQVVKHAASSVGIWLAHAREARCLVTSREKLGLDGEHVRLVEPLAPDAGLDLFATRARRLQPGLDLGGAAAGAAREIVRLVDGMPLAIELAAARVRVMTVSQIVDEMRDRFRLLTGGTTTQHETLEVAIDGSWELLTDWEKWAWAQCSVFEDGFSLEAAERVLDLNDWPGPPVVVDVLQGLADHSLLTVESTPGMDGAEVRFGMYVSLKEYARRKLGEWRDLGPAAAHSAEEKHGRWYAQLGTDEAIDGLDEFGGAERRRKIEAELSNLIAACRRALGRRDGAVATATYRAAVEVFAMRGPFQTGIEIGRELIGGAELRAPERARVLWALAKMERVAGTKESARAHSEEALTLARGLPNRRLVALLVGWLGALDYDQGASESALARYQEALAIHQEEGDRGRTGVVLSHIGMIDHIHGRHELAISHYQTSLELLREAGDRRREGYVRGFLGSLYREQGRYEDALTEQTAALAIHQEVGDRLYEGLVVGNLGNLHMQMGHVEQARACYESAVAVARDMGDQRNEGLFLSNLGQLLLQQGLLEDARVCIETALGHHRRVGTRRYEGFALRLLGRLLHREGRIEAARRELADAETILRETGFDVELVKLLCHRGELELDTSNVAGARATLEEIESMFRAHGWREEGELAGTIGTLREAINGRAVPLT